MKIYFSVFILVFSLLFVSNAKAQNENKLKQKIEQQTEDKPLEILKKPRANGNFTCPKGLAVVIVEVTFHSSGKVTDARIVEPSVCDAFDMNAVKASKKIKFKSELKNGEAVTIIKKVHYSFRLEDKF